MEPENRSGGVNDYLLLGGLAVSSLGVYYQREAIMATLRRTQRPRESLSPSPYNLSQNQSQAAIFG